MKKLSITLLALVAIVTAVNAQGMSEEQREKTLYNLIIRMRPVGTQYAITTTPNMLSLLPLLLIMNTGLLQARKLTLKEPALRRLQKYRRRRLRIWLRS